MPFLIALLLFGSMIGGGYFYYQDSQATIARLRDNNAKLSLVAETNQATINQLQQDAENTQARMEELAIRAKEAEESRKMAERSSKVSKLQPGKTFYLKENWYKAIKKLEEFLKIDYMDEDLVQEASKMLAESKKNLDNTLRPLLRKAERMKEARV